MHWRPRAAVIAYFHDKTEEGGPEPNGSRPALFTTYFAIMRPRRRLESCGGG
jgi:hypothetical protein